METNQVPDPLKAWLPCEHGSVVEHNIWDATHPLLCLGGRQVLLVPTEPTEIWWCVDIAEDGYEACVDEIDRDERQAVHGEHMECGRRWIAAVGTTWTIKEIE